MARRESNKEKASHIPQTAAAWADWHRIQQSKTRNRYLQEPDLLISEFRREQEITRDYVGREILELLQNANDAATELEEPGKVVIELRREGLIVANTGRPFSADGVKSIQIDHLSPKRAYGKTLIGNKGLGFRAVLNWSSSPIVLSQALELAYTPSHLGTVLQDLAHDSKEIDERVQEESQLQKGPILPRLPFPAFADRQSLEDQIGNGKQRTLLGRCRHWQSAGYTTVIGMPFDTANAANECERQLSVITPELLLFAQALSELEIIRNASRSHWRCIRENDQVTIHDASGNALTWRVSRKSGSVPVKYLEDSNVRTLTYEVVVAVPKQTQASSNRLFTYFPTDVALPLRAVCHATLELEQNRKHIQEGAANKFVLGELANLVADVAEKETRTSQSPWAGFDLIKPRNPFDQVLMRLGFSAALMAAVKNKAIIPTISNKRLKPRDARRVESASPDWLPPQLFPEVAAVRDRSDYTFLYELDVKSLEQKDLVGRSMNAPNLPIDTRSALIIGLLTLAPDEFEPTAAVLVDDRSRPIPPETRVYLLSPNASAGLPDWAQLRFLNEELRTKLQEALNLSDARSFQQRMGAFGVSEYSLHNLVRSLVAQTAKRIKARPSDAESVQRDLVIALFELFSSQPPAQQIAAFPEASPISLPNKKRTWLPADNLYLSAAHEPYGRVSEALYSWAPEKLVASAKALGLPASTTTTEFLLWIGVAKFPREVKATVTRKESDAYVDHVLHSLTYPAYFEEYVISEPGMAYYASIAEAVSVDGLPEILSKSDPVAVLAWMAQDGRADAWKRLATSYGYARAWPSDVRRIRVCRQAIPSLVHWQLMTTPWLPLSNGKTGKPQDCVLVERLIEAMFPRPALPPADRLAHFGLDDAQVRDAWLRAGVMASLTFLSRDEVYQKLLDLPNTDPTGESARSFYRWFLDFSDSLTGRDGPAHTTFKYSGKLWGVQGAKRGYFPVAQLRHIDVDGVPKDLAKRLALVALPKRSGAEKIERLFNVKAFDRTSIEQGVVAKNQSVWFSEVDAAFQAAKPFLYRLRQSQTSHVQQLASLKKIRLELCDRLRVAVRYEQVGFEYEADDWHWLISEDAILVKVPSSHTISLDSDLLVDAVSAAVAAMFRIASNGDFARILRCAAHDRRELLLRILGEESDAELDKLELEFEEAQRGGAVPFPPPPTAPKPANPKGTGGQATPEEAETPRNTPPQSLRVEEQAHQPAPKKPGRRLQIQSVIGAATDGNATSRRVTDGAFCEQKALEFEGSDGRFPQLVSHVTGSDAFGCDILSFASAADRAAFVTDQGRNLALVRRFIEVKGRADSLALIELKGNELAAATRFSERYFLYRLFEGSGGEYLLTTLQNPLADSNAVERVLHVSLEAAANTKRYKLSHGLTR